MRPGDKLPDGVLLAFGNRLDGAVLTVADPAGQTQCLAPITRVKAEADPLHLAVNAQVHATPDARD